MRSSLFLVCCVFSSSVLGRPYILFANRQDLRLVEITDNKRKTNTNIIVKNLEDAAALDYFLEKNIVCWSEINREVIRCADIDPRAKGKVAKQDVVNTGLIKPEGLACDWLGMKIYWTDADTKRIEVTGLSGEEYDRAVLVWEDLDLPRAISLAPHDGLMFWTDWGEYPRIERIGMNGDPETRQILVDRDLGWPNGLTLDYSTKRLYWLEAKLAYIASVDWNGSNRKTILVGDGHTLPQPFAMTVFADVLYWTDWDTKSLNMYNQSTGELEKLKIRGKLNPMDVRVFEPKKQPKGSSPTPCSIDNGQCSHLCLAAPYNPGYSCHCPTGIKLVNATHCAKKNSAILLLAARDNIRKVSLDTPDFTDSVIPLTGVINSIAIDYDPVSEKVFWTDDQVRAIRAANLDGSDERSVITEEVSHPDGVAVDWVSGQLFWTDTGTDRIEVAKLNGSSRRVVISEDLDEPRGIVLDLINGWMYWSDWGKHPRIERAWMDGRSRSIIIDTGLVWPNGIAIDVERQKLYWCDAKKDRIETSNVDGTGRVPVLDEMVPHPFGFSLLGEHLYWTDWQDRSIERADKYNGKKRQVLVSHLDDLMGVKAVLASPNPNVTNACATKACSHLCLITPAGALCACPNGYELTQDDLTCVVPEAFILYTQDDHIKRISLDSRNRNNFVIPVKDVQEPNALDFDKTDGRIYWSDLRKKTISRSFLNGSNFEIVVQFGLEFPEGLSVDWLAGNLYWSDTGSNRIEVSRLDGSNRRVLLWRDLHSPKSIAVDPIGGQIYWSSWGKDPVIETCALDGSGRSIFMNDVSKATGLTIDYTSNKLYWAEQGKGAIMSSSLSSPSSPEAVISSSVKPYGLIVYESWVYWTDWTNESIERTSLESPKTTRTVVQSDMDNVQDLVVFHKEEPSKDESNPCYLNKTECGGLCLAKKSSIFNSQLTAQCGCPSHFTIEENEVSCQGPKSFLLFSQKNKISRLLLDPHLPDEVPNIVLPVKRARSIHALDFDPAERIIYWVDLGAVRSEGRPGRQIIRRSKETGDSDKLGVFAKMEKFPPFDLVIDPFTRTLYWTSANTNAINVTRLDPEELSHIGPLMIGGINDKPRLLALHAEKQLLVVTMSGGVEEGGARIEVFNLHTHLRDVIVNTSLGEITAVTVDSSEDKIYWMDILQRKMSVCGMDGSGRRVIISEGIVEPVGIAVQGQWIYWADRDQATIVRINKETGASRQVILDKIPHLSSIIAVNYIPQAELTSHPCHSSKCSHLCSSTGTTHSCSCPPGLVLSSDLLTCTNPPTCKPDEFTCGGPGPRSGPACIPLQWRCDGQSECGDSSDEMDCPECGPAQFRCQDGQCIPGSRLCDGIAQCNDRTDELMCCGKEEFQCAVTGKCIENDKVCDGHHDCSDASDELQPSCNLESNLPATGSIAVIANTSTYLIAIFAGMISMLVLGLSVYCCKRWYLGRRIYVSRPPELTETIPPQQTEMLTGPSLPINGQKNHTEGEEEPTFTILGSGANAQLYERGHVTGASSNTGSSNTGGHYPAVHPGPPPSPATSVVTRLSSLIPRANRTQHHSTSRSSSAFNAGVPSGYQYYSPRAHPCTPCSTDVADSDVADSVAYSALTVPHHRPHFTSRAASLAPSRNGYESEGPDADQLEMRGTRSRYVAPPSSYVGAPPSYVGAPPSYVGAPPSTPFYLSEFEDPETSCPPSPVTERSFFINPYLPDPRPGPLGPPPSPVPSRSPIDSPTINHLHPHT